MWGVGPKCTLTLVFFNSLLFVFSATVLHQVGPPHDFSFERNFAHKSNTKAKSGIKSLGQLKTHKYLFIMKRFCLLQLDHFIFY